jgi:hypothetical protein
VGYNQELTNIHTYNDLCEQLKNSISSTCRMAIHVQESAQRTRGLSKFALYLFFLRRCFQRGSGGSSSSSSSLSLPPPTAGGREREGGHTSLFDSLPEIALNDDGGGVEHCQAQLVVF